MRVLLLFFVLIILLSCSDQTTQVGQIGADRDIVLVNIENGDRAFIANILAKLDSIKPKVVGISVFFESSKGTKEDSLLFQALNILKGDILSYGINETGDEKHSIPVFTSAVDTEGLLEFEETNGLVSKFTPAQKIAGKLHECFALKVAKSWNPNLNISYPEDKSVYIEYTRTLNSFLVINGSDLIALPITEFDAESLKEKIFLVGYTGPDKEDMYRTPLRFLSQETMDRREPDTYGLVIIANQIRTLLDRNTK